MTAMTLPADDSEKGPPPGDARRPAERIAAELAVAMGRPERVAGDAEALGRALRHGPSDETAEALSILGAALRRASGPAVAPAAAILSALAREAGDPWPFLEAMLMAREAGVFRAALDDAVALAAAGRLAAGEREARALAARLEDDPRALDPPEIARAAGRLFGEGLLPLFLDGTEPRVRLLAARLLDAAGGPAPAAIAEAALGAAAWGALRPYLEYTRATHVDLVYLAPRRGEPSPVVDDLARATEACGEAALREIVATLSWPSVALGLEAAPLAAVRVGGSLPLFVRPTEATLLGRCRGARRAGSVLLVTAHGGMREAVATAVTADDPVARYRGMNLAHASALRDILDVAPLDRPRVERLIALLDRIVADHAALFAEFDAGCAALPGLWSDLRVRIEVALAREGEEIVLSPDLTRLVLAFEDPPSLGAVTTLHGLKRFLHQRSLKLGFRLVRSGAATNRSIDLLVAEGGRVQRRAPTIRWVDFEESAGGTGPPHSVRVVARSFARALLHGRTSFPATRVFCYGNEVHYYLTYGTHPALIRIDWAPPLRGGMVDLEYYGVSRYDLESHPNRDLDALRLVFQRLDFAVTVEPNTRVHARYDKERARDLGDLADRIGALFRLAPYLMDLDWVLGDLRLSREAQGLVARAWAEIFAGWGAIPYERLLTRDRLGILASVEEGPSGAREIAWDGSPPYRDLHTPDGVEAFVEDLRREHSLAGLAASFDERSGLPAQLALERAVLEPLREAEARGAVVVEEGRPRAAAAEVHESLAPAEVFARILAGTLDEAVAAACLAGVVAPIERTLAFRTTGTVNGHVVQAARLPLVDRVLTLNVLRGPRGIARFALLAEGSSLARNRPAAGAAWIEPHGYGAAEAAEILRASGYEPAVGDLDPEAERAETAAARERFLQPNALAPPRLLPGEIVVAGVAASPGRATGHARLGTEGRSAEDLEGAVLVVPTLRPEDGPLLARAAAVVSTGGGILSHAGLVAAQWERPALVVPGCWPAEGQGARVLLSVETFTEYERRVGEFAVTVRRGSGERPVAVEEGDLLVVDADLGLVRILGRHPDALALHDGLRALAAAAARLGSATDPREVLTARGERLRARHRVVAVLARLDDPVLIDHAVREILVGETLRAEGGPNERGELLAPLLENPTAGTLAAGLVRGLASDLDKRHRDAREEAQRRMPEAASLHEALALRVEAARLRGTIVATSEALAACGILAPTPPAGNDDDLDLATARRLSCFRAREAERLDDGSDPGLRHRLRFLDRLDALLGLEPDPRARAARARLTREDGERAAALSRSRVAAADAIGLEGVRFVGGKAANLGEVARLVGAERVPPWFAVADGAFREMLDARAPRGAPGAEGCTLAQAIGTIEGRDEEEPRSRASAIRGLFERATVPAGVREAIAEGYRLLGGGDAEPLVAVRSSALVEDAEEGAHAGEFDTFLGVRGEGAVLEHVKRAWAGLWSERALRARALADPAPARPGGGVVVQRMADARVAGVVQTIHVALGDPRKIVVNAGLGLGEGVVSGAVAADEIVVEKEGDLERGPLRFRYTTADKRERVALDRSGTGTVRVESLYHQRLRPALEYVELLEIVGCAVRLERAYAQPLDIEFALEGDRLWILQVRPVPAHAALVRETLGRYPLREAARRVRETAQEVRP